MKVCIFGGTFDPIHLGHESIVNKLLKKFDKVIVVPNGQSPHKKNPPIANKISRLKMLSLCSFSKNLNCIISDYELISEKRTNYTIETVSYIFEKFKGAELYLAIGLDQLYNIKTWHEASKLLSMVKIICFNRTNISIDFDNYSNIDYDLIEDFNCDISSSLIRNYIINNDSIASSMINEKVDQYIKEKNIYK